MARDDSPKPEILEEGIGMTSSAESLYDRSSQPCVASNPNPYPPGTSLTASVETIDNDRSDALLAFGVVR